MSKKGKLQFNPLELVEGMLECLSGKEADIIRRRFGFRGNAEGESAKETLEGIGRAYSITRERVRQIQNQSIGRIRDSIGEPGNAETVAMVEKAVESVISRHGGIMEEGELLSGLLESEKDAASKKASVFLLSEILSDNIQKVGQGAGMNPAWKTGSAPIDVFEKTVGEVLAIFAKTESPMAEEELLKTFKKGAFYAKNKESLTDVAIMSYLKASKKVKRNAFGEWGIVDWQTITPKRISDKIYLVLKKHGKPVHFTEIADMINDMNFDKKRAHPATVHNELILDKEKYVLVGRGIYALSEWGYKPGVIADLLADILRSGKGPMTKEALAKQVLKQRIVRKETIYLSLMNKERFFKTKAGKYELAG